MAMKMSLPNNLKKAVTTGSRFCVDIDSELMGRLSVLSAFPKNQWEQYKKLSCDADQSDRHCLCSCYICFVFSFSCIFNSAMVGSNVKWINVLRSTMLISLWIFFAQRMAVLLMAKRFVLWILLMNACMILIRMKHLVFTEQLYPESQFLGKMPVWLFGHMWWPAYASVIRRRSSSVTKWGSHVSR